LDLLELWLGGNMALWSIYLHIKMVKGTTSGHALLREFNYYHTLKQSVLQSHNFFSHFLLGFKICQSRDHEPLGLGGAGAMPGSRSVQSG